MGYRVDLTRIKGTPNYSPEMVDFYMKSPKSFNITEEQRAELDRLVAERQG